MASSCELLNPKMITVTKLKHVDARVYNRITTKPKDDEEGIAD
jgi:hypothetical protein